MKSSATDKVLKKRRLAERTPKPKGAPAAASAAAPPPAAAPSASSSGRAWTVSLALPGSIVDNAQTQELRSHLVGQVARAATIFNVDEIVVFSSDGASPAAPQRTDGSVFMARLLQYLECPQYLRKAIFPMHPDLRCVGLVAPLDAANHPRATEQCAYREGLISEKGGSKDGRSGAIVGLPKEVSVDRRLPAGTRVTVRMPSRPGEPAAVVPPREPREKLGLHWGFSVRLAKDLPSVWSECPFGGGYDLSLGTSDKGDSDWLQGEGFRLPAFKHLLIVFGGVEGLEPVVEAHPELAAHGIETSALFDLYLNLCPGQGSRTIRTEEALLVGLAALQPHTRRAGAS